MSILVKTAAEFGQTAAKLEGGPSASKRVNDLPVVSLRISYLKEKKIAATR
jgi:hypothetical protein